MTRHPFFLKSLLMASAWVVVGVLCSVTAFSQESGDTTSTAAVMKRPLAMEVNIPGVFEADNKEEYSIEPSEYRGDLIITKLLAEGAQISVGDVLVEFDTTELDEAIANAANEVIDAKIAVTKTTAELKTAEIDQAAVLAQLEKELEMARTEWQAAKEQEAVALAEKEKAIADAERGHERSQEDHQQLVDLYNAHDNHTETEELLMERSEESIQDASKQVKQAKQNLEYFKKYEMSQDTFTKEIAVTKKETEIAKQKIQLEAELAGKRREVTKAERQLTNKQDVVYKLETDKRNLRIVAARDGVLFYGTPQSGSDFADDFFGFGGNQNEMKIGGRVKTHSILVTVASMEKLVIKMQIMENDIQYLKAGLPITVLPDAFPNLQLNGTLTQVDMIAKREGFFSDVRRFSVRGEYEYSDLASELRAGMNCRVVVHVDSVSDALQIPIAAVFAEDGKYYCYVKEAQPAKREVSIGASNADWVQITKGLNAGEEIYLVPPQ